MARWFNVLSLFNNLSKKVQLILQKMKNRILIICLFFFTNNIFAQNKDEKYIAETIETIRKAMVDGDKAALDANTHANLSYGHSNGRIENKTQFVEAIASGNNDFQNIEISNQTIQISGNTAIARFNFDGNYTNAGVPGVAKLAVLQVFQKSGKKWLLLARQAVKI